MKNLIKKLYKPVKREFLRQNFLFNFSFYKPFIILFLSSLDMNILNYRIVSSTQKTLYRRSLATTFGAEEDPRSAQFAHPEHLFDKIYIFQNLRNMKKHAQCFIKK